MARAPCTSRTAFRAAAALLNPLAAGCPRAHSIEPPAPTLCYGVLATGLRLSAPLSAPSWAPLVGVMAIGVADFEEEWLLMAAWMSATVKLEAHLPVFSSAIEKPRTQRKRSSRFASSKVYCHRPPCAAAGEACCIGDGSMLPIDDEGSMSKTSEKQRLPPSTPAGGPRMKSTTLA